MRKATVAKLSLTALVGICSFVGSANIAAAGPGPQQGSIKVAPTTSTTMKPLIAEPADYCDFHLCLEAAPAQPELEKPADKAGPKEGKLVVPQAEEGCPSTDPTCPPPGDDCPLGTVCPPEDDCLPIPGAADCPKEDPCDDDGPIARSQIDPCDPCDDGPSVLRVNDPSGQPDPCDPCETDDDGPGQAARLTDCDPCDEGPGPQRHGGDEDDPCDGDDPCETDDRPEGPQRSQIEDCDPDDDPCLDLPGGGKRSETGGDDCGGTTGHDGRLPKTGGDIVTMAGLGLGLTGIGAAVKRLGRRNKQDQE